MFDTQRYWEHRYAYGGHSGTWGRLAQFKAQVINDITDRYALASIADLGCGDGVQAALLTRPRASLVSPWYYGFDIAPSAVARTRARFGDDAGRLVTRYDPGEFSLFRAVDRSEGRFAAPIADLALSLDVIFHLVSDNELTLYLADLFVLARRAVLIYNIEDPAAGALLTAAHVRYQPVRDRIAERFPTWRLVETIPPRYPEAAEPDADPYDVSDCEFSFYQRARV